MKEYLAVAWRGQMFVTDEPCFVLC